MFYLNGIESIEALFQRSSSLASNVTVYLVLVAVESVSLCLKFFTPPYGQQYGFTAQTQLF